VRFLFSVASTDDRLSQQLFDLAVCNECQLLYVATERPQLDRRAVFEDPQYMNIVRCCQTWRDWNVKNHFIRRLDALERHGARGRLLDIGCGDGLFLQIARARGWDGHGLEFNPGLAAEASPLAPGKIIRSSAEILAFADDTFQAVTLIHVLEHLDAPRGAIREARRILRPGGLLYVAIPCLDTQVRSLLMAIPSSGLRRWAFMGAAELWPPDHLSHFPARTLRHELECDGFQILEQAFLNNPFPFGLPHPIIRRLWFFSRCISPVLRLLGSGLHYEVLARRT
jgi:SAM-dependent methyltransferase